MCVCWAAKPGPVQFEVEAVNSNSAKVTLRTNEILKYSITYTATGDKQNHNGTVCRVSVCQFVCKDASRLACARILAQCTLILSSFCLGVILLGYFVACLDALLCVLLL